MSIRRPAPARHPLAGDAPVLAGITVQLLEEEATDPVHRAEVLDRAGLPPDALDDPNATIPHDAMCQIWSELTDEHTDLAFGIRFADRVWMRALGVAGYLAASSATASDAVQRVTAYHRLLKSAGDVSLLIEDGRLRVIEFPPPGAVRWPRHLTEAILACYPSLTSRLTGAKIPACEVRVQHPDPGCAARAEAERAFGCAVEFDAQINEIVLPCDALDIEVRTSDPGLNAHLEQLAIRMLAELPEPDEVLAAVRTAIAEALPSGGVSLPMVARRLGYGERTLQRRLNARGVTLQDLVSEIRQSAAQRLLADRDLTIEDVAMLLGFSDPSGLRRAYRRWFGHDLRRSPART